MNFFSNFIENVKQKKADLDEKRQFARMVDDQAKPIRRAAYMKEALAQAIQEGKEKAKQDSTKRVPVKKTTPQQFGLAEGLANPFKYLEGHEVKKPNFTPPKTNLTKSKKQKNKKNG